MSKNFYEIIESELNDKKNKRLFRELKENSYSQGAWVNVGNKKLLQFCSNDYLGLSKDNRIFKAIAVALEKYGNGSTGSRLITGTHPLHLELEKKISSLKNTQASLVYSCGYSANVGLISALVNENDAVYSDELNHASIIDGIKLSKANKYIYKHNNIEHLEALLAENTHKNRLNLIITDSIFSMDGDRAPLKEIVRLKNKYNCILYVDEAHAFGIYGKKGEGLVGEYNLCNDVEIQMGTLSKAIGSDGGYVSGKKVLVDYLVNKSRSFIYSTAPSISTVSASLKALEIIENENELRNILFSNIEYFSNNLKSVLKDKNLNLLPQDSAIFAIEFGDAEKTLKIAYNLNERFNIQAVAIRPPTVKKPVIRFTLSALHTKKDIDYLLTCLSSI